MPSLFEANKAFPDDIIIPVLALISSYQQSYNVNVARQQYEHGMSKNANMTPRANVLDSINMVGLPIEVKLGFWLSFLSGSVGAH